MFNLFAVLSSFSSSLVRVAKVSDQTKFLFLNGEPYMVRPTLIDLNPVEFKYYPFMISLNTFTGSFSVLSPKICVPKEIKDINVKTFNMITNNNDRTYFMWL